VVKPNAVDLNLGSFTDPLVELAGATNHGTEWIGKLVAESFSGDGGGVTHHVAIRGAG
jgi:hypothetical protein